MFILSSSGNSHRNQLILPLHERPLPSPPTSHLATTFYFPTNPLPGAKIPAKKWVARAGSAEAWGVIDAVIKILEGEEGRYSKFQTTPHPHLFLLFSSPFSPPPPSLYINFPIYFLLHFYLNGNTVEPRPSLTATGPVKERRVPFQRLTQMSIFETLLVDKIPEAAFHFHSPLVL